MASEGTVAFVPLFTRHSPLTVSFLERSYLDSMNVPDPDPNKTYKKQSSSFSPFGKGDKPKAAEEKPLYGSSSAPLGGRGQNDQEERYRSMLKQQQTDPKPLFSKPPSKQRVSGQDDGRVQQLTQENLSLREKIQQLEQQTSSSNDREAMRELTDRNAGLQSRIQQLEQHIREISSSSSQNQQVIQNLMEENSQLKNWASNLQNQLQGASNDGSMQELIEHNSYLQNQVQAMQQQLQETTAYASNDGQMQELMQQNSYLQNEVQVLQQELQDTQAMLDKALQIMEQGQ